MNNLFEVIDKTNRKVRLTKTQFEHILRHKGREQHLESIQEALRKPFKVIFRKEGNLSDYYLYFKERKSSRKYLKVVVKYLNGEGFVITAYFVANIK